MTNLPDNSKPFEPEWRFILFSTLSFGAYEWYWGWRAWAVVRAADQRSLNATLRAAFLGFTTFGLAKALYAKKRSGKALYYSAGAYLAVSLLLAIIIGMFKPEGWLLVGAYLMMGLVEGLVLLPFHRALKRSWRNHPGMAHDPRLKPNWTLAGTIVLMTYFSMGSALGITKY